MLINIMLNTDMHVYAAVDCDKKNTALIRKVDNNDVSMKHWSPSDEILNLFGAALAATVWISLWDWYSAISNFHFFYNIYVQHDNQNDFPLRAFPILRFFNFMTKW